MANRGGMRLNVFSVVGEALNFGARRMETIMRAAWLPVVLLLIVNMTVVFSVLSIGADHLITFKDLRGGTFAMAEQAAAAKLGAGFAQGEPLAIAIVAGWALVNMALVSSFMAPLIRYSGLGEKPRAGVMRAPFGLDQLRYIAASLASSILAALFSLGPVLLASHFVGAHLKEALSKNYASFPNEESLHTIELVPAADKLEAEGSLWLYEYGVWSALAVIAVLGVFWLLVAHFHPDNRDVAPRRPNVFARGFVVALALAGLFSIALTFASLNFDKSLVPANAYPFLIFASALVLLGAYLSVRLYAYPGVAVCRRSMSPAGVLAVTRGWNVVKLGLALVFIWALLMAVQLIVNSQVFVWLSSTLVTLFSATSVYTRIVGGETGAWVLPFFVWLWTLIKLAYTIFWTFFTYGVSAGLLGRLYRESERAPRPTAVEQAVWRRDPAAT